LSSPLSVINEVIRETTERVDAMDENCVTCKMIYRRTRTGIRRTSGAFFCGYYCEECWNNETKNDEDDELLDQRIKEKDRFAGSAWPQNG